MEHPLKIHIAGAFGIETILRFNQGPKPPLAAFESYFPFKRYLPEAVLLSAETNAPDPEAVLLIINLSPKIWDFIQPRLVQYKKTILIQFEAKIGWELAYEKSIEFDHFINFDRNQKSHPGFHQMYIPYDPILASSGRDKRGFNAVVNQWKSSRKLFVETYLLRALPRKKKSVLIATLNPNDHYKVRKLIADKWPQMIDVFGGGWPKTMCNYRGFVSSKVDLLRRYRYCLVMENQRQNGYITEKLFDCLPAETVPIYWGAPDIHDISNLDWVPVIEDENFALGQLLEDNKLYRSLYKQLKHNRKSILDVFSIHRFIGMLCNVIKSCYQENA